jgi:secondary thiamine-phosphate synthase enzyme
MIHAFTIATRTHDELIDITANVADIVRAADIEDGICFVYTPHTTAAITINENADPSVQRDILKGLAHLQFEKVSFSHLEGNSPSHLKSSIIGCSASIFVERGRLHLGTWQGIYFCEFDGPRSRQVLVKIIGS